MRLAGRVLIVVALLFPASRLRAQTAVDPSGHWEGSISTAGGEFRLELDLARNARGEIAGTITLPAQKIKALRLKTVTVSGTAMTFVAATTSFSADLAADGTTMAGEVAAEAGTAPFALARKGEARFEAAPRSPAITKELEGTWNGAIDVEGRHLRLVMRISNQPDGTSMGSIVSLDEGEIESPIAIVQNAANVTLKTQMNGSTFSGVLNDAGTELVGTFAVAGLEVPLAFHRAGN